MAGVRWAIVTGEYPPDPGGVADYTSLVAEALVAAGDDVTVFVPGSESEPSGLATIVRLRHGFTPRGLPELYRRVSGVRPQRILVQYVAQSFGLRAVNIPLVLLLRVLGSSAPLWVMFHEYAIAHDPSQTRARQAQAFGTRVMARLMTGAAARLMVSTAAWIPRIRAVVPRAAIDVVPIPSNLPTETDASTVAELRAKLGDPDTRIVGHFGTYRMEESRRLLQSIVPEILGREPRASFLFLGRAGDRFAEELRLSMPAYSTRIVGTGELDRDRAALHLACCDVLVQPYAEGVTTRRGSLLGGLALGVPTVTTYGDLTEDLWCRCKAVAFADSHDAVGVAVKALELLNDSVKRARLSSEAKSFYRAHFALERTLEQLRQA